MMTGRALDRQKIAAAILHSLDRLHPRLEAGFDRIIAAAESRSFLKGKWIHAQAGDAMIEGRASHVWTHEGGFGAAAWPMEPNAPSPREKSPPAR